MMAEIWEALAQVSSNTKIQSHLLPIYLLFYFQILTFTGDLAAREPSEIIGTSEKQSSHSNSNQYNYHQESPA